MKHPETILSDILWSFNGGIRPKADEFSKEIGEYQREITGKDTWKPEEIVYPFPRIAINYIYWDLEEDEEEEIEEVIFLDAMSPSGFTALELMYKLHNATIENLEDMDHHFFEGLTLMADWIEEGLPVYDLGLGS